MGETLRGGPPDHGIFSRGAYTVSETCRILRPSMTPRKVHYWLDTDLLGTAVQRGSRGVPTILTFDQVLKVRTLQFLRDELDFSLQRVRQALAKLVDGMFREDWQALDFFKAIGSGVGVKIGSEEVLTLPSEQQVLEGTIARIGESVEKGREDWQRRAVDIEGFPMLISNARILSGAPTIRGSRIETAFVAHVAMNGEVAPLSELRRLFPHVEKDALEQALVFEGLKVA